MNISKRNYLIFFFAVGGVIAAVWFIMADDAAVDTKYLQSEEFEKLDEDLKKEIRNNAPSLKEYIVNLIEKDQLSVLELPFEMDSVTIRELMVRHDEKNKTGSYRAENYPVGYIPFDSLKTVLLIRKKPGIYPHIEIVLATVVRNSLIDTRMVGQIKKTLAETVNTKLYINSEREVRSKMNRRINYPIRQENIETNYYTIHPSGKILVDDS